MFSVNMKDERIGEERLIPNSGTAVIVDYVTRRDVTVSFKNTGYTFKTTYSQFKHSNLVNKLLPTVYGVGVVGYEDVSVDGVLLKSYEVWKSMLMRCYCKKASGLSRYEDVTVSDTFKYYKNFKDWCQNQIGYDQEGWHLDKDLLVKGNRVYSENACCFVLPEINSALCDQTNKNKNGLPTGVSKVGKKFQVRCRVNGKHSKHIGIYTTVDEATKAYKYVKESHIKSLADKWRNMINPRAYEALINWEISIDD